MIGVLYNLLNNNQVLIELIGSNRIFPVFTTDMSSPSIVYSARPLKGDTSVFEFLYTVNIIWTDFDLILQIEKLLNQLLHFADSSIFIEIDNYVFNSINAGGRGFIYNSELKVFEYGINFKITYKEN